MVQLVSSKSLFHSSEPLVVGAVSSAEMLRALAANPLLAAGCDILELRLDAIGLEPDASRELASKLETPLLITARHPDEGGIGNLASSTRSTLLDAHLDLAVLMDVELRSAPDLQSVVSRAKALGVGIIGSYHDFLSTPADDILRGAVESGVRSELDMVKVATMLQSPEDLARLIHLVGAEKRVRMSVMGMGPLGRLSRLALARCGSLLNYGYLGESNAPGQWEASRLKQLLKEL